MLKVKVENDVCDVEVSGDVSKIAIDICNMISCVYNAIKKQDEEQATTLGSILVLMLLDEESPVWSDEEEMDGTVVLSLEQAKRF